MKILSYIIILITLIACSTFQPQLPNQKLEVDKFYKRDMIINGYEGVLVLPKQPSYEMKIEARGDLDLFVMTTCSREYSKEKAWNVQQVVKSGPFGWGNKKIDKPREVQFQYIPTELEGDGFCSMELAGYELTGGKHSWGYVDFENEKFQLTATMNCNGQTYISNGVSVCQSKEGLFQKIKFSSPVKTASGADCNIKGEGSEFEFKIKKDYCVTLFKELNTGKIHKLTTVGYENILIRQ